MAAKPTLQMNVDKFNAALSGLERALKGRVTREQIIDAESRKVIEATIKRTKTATRASIAKNAATRKWRTYYGKKYYLENRYPNRVWAQIQKKLADSLKIKYAAIGLARRAWYEIGIKIGPINAPAQTKKAVAPGFTPGSDTSVKKTSTEYGYGIIIENNSPLIRFSDSRQALFGALAGRAGFFKRNLAKGVFNDMANVLKRYPGFKVTPPN